MPQMAEFGINSANRLPDRTTWSGDNLDVLRGLTYASVHFIYLDPPFNSNRNCAAPVGSVAVGIAWQAANRCEDAST